MIVFWAVAPFTRSKEIRSLPNQVQRLRPSVDRLHLIAPELASQIETMLERIERLGRGHQCTEFGLVHADAKPTNFVVNGARVGFVDFDLVSVGDPALDVGSFLAHIREHDVWSGVGELGRLSSHFLAEYESRNPENELIPRARLFESLDLLRMAIRAFLAAPYSYAKKQAASRPVQLLEGSAECLERLRS